MESCRMIRVMMMTTMMMRMMMMVVMMVALTMVNKATMIKMVVPRVTARLQVIWMRVRTKKLIMMMVLMMISGVDQCLGGYDYDVVNDGAVPAFFGGLHKSELCSPSRPSASPHRPYLRERIEDKVVSGWASRQRD